MGIFKKLTVRSRPKTVGLATGDRSKSEGVDAPELATSLASPRPTKPTPFEPERYVGEDEEADPGKILIGIDFGTTFSGVAWSYSKQPDEINIITNWDSAEYETSDKGKAPTKLSYKPSQVNDEGYLPQCTWGYGVGDDEAVEWFKLLLLDDSDMEQNSPQLIRARRILERAAKTPVQAVADYLRLLWAHTITNLERALGEAALEGLPYVLVCTVPAVWPNKAVNKMREAAKQAGILETRLAGRTVLRFVSEPEAAALATFEDLRNKPNLKVGDSFVVCDAGGGTVDLISYQVTQLRPMQLRESVEGSGGMCGAVFLDQEFEGLMLQWMGDAWNVDDSVIKTLMNTQWENGIKRGFDGKNRSWKITLPWECTQRGAPSRIELTPGHVQQIFDNVVSKIRLLVSSQVAAIEVKDGRLPKAIILVGGFGSCRYLYNLLNAEYKHRGIEVHQSPGNKPWTAICRGAVLKAFTNASLPGPVVQTRISRCNYGTRYNCAYDPAIHLPCDLYTDPATGMALAQNQLDWYLTRGSNIDETKPVQLPWNRKIFGSQYLRTMRLKASIVVCEDKVPPIRQTGVVLQEFEIISEEDIDITDVRPNRALDGRYYKRVAFSIEMTVIGAALEFALIYKGKRIGHTQLEPDLDDGYEPQPTAAMAELGAY